MLPTNGESFSVTLFVSVKDRMHSSSGPCFFPRIRIPNKFCVCISKISLQSKSGRVEGCVVWNRNFEACSNFPGSALKNNVLSSRLADQLGSLPSHFGNWNVVPLHICHLKRAGFACYNLVTCFYWKYLDLVFGVINFVAKLICFLLLLNMGRNGYFAFFNLPYQVVNKNAAGSPFPRLFSFCC